MNTVKKFWQVSTKRRLIYMIVICFALYAPTYIGYCQGWWGRDSLLLRKFSSCACYTDVENSFFPNEHITVAISGCTDQFVRSVKPAHGFAVIAHYETNDSSISLDPDAFLWDPLTNQKEGFPAGLTPNAFFPLNSNYLYWSGSSNRALWHWRTNEIIFVQDRTIQFIELLTNKNTSESELFSAVYAEIDYVFTNEDHTVSIFVDEQMEHNKTHRLVQANTDIDTKIQDILTNSPVPVHKFKLSGLGLHYSGFCCAENELVSPDGRFVATNDGVFSIETGQQLVNTENLIVQKRIESLMLRYEPVGYIPSLWLADSSGVIYSYNLQNKEWADQQPIPGFPRPRELDQPVFPVPILKVSIPESLPKQ